MLKGTRTAIIKKIQPVSIHGQISLDVYFVDPDDPQGQVSLARLGAGSDAPPPRAWRSRRPALPGGGRDLDHEIVRIACDRYLGTVTPPCFPLPLYAHWRLAPQLL